MIPFIWNFGKGKTNRDTYKPQGSTFSNISALIPEPKDYSDDDINDDGDDEDWDA